MQNNNTQQADTSETKLPKIDYTTCCIAGSGPAGAVLALLLARQGIPVILLEEHMDFDRDFRGDTIHPSVMRIMDELGLAGRLLQLKHTEMRSLTAQTVTGPITIADFQRLKTKYPYITMLPQVDFLNFITNEAKKYPNFQLVMGARVEKLIEENGKVLGVLYRGQDSWHEVHALLTVAADGRFSRMRRLAQLEPIQTSPPMDILWFKLPRKPTDPEEAFGRFGVGHLIVIINRYDYWQIGYVIPKGGYQQARAAGLEKLRQSVIDLAPELAGNVQHLRDWRQVSVLSVESNRLPRWYKPGLLLIGDAAHVMSPVGGVGINYAIMDAVVAANVLSGPLKANRVQVSDLAKVQRQRELPTRIIQAFQSFVQDQVLAATLKSSRPFTVPSVFRFLLSLPVIRDLPARLVAFGIFPAHVEGLKDVSSPAQGASRASASTRTEVNTRRYH